MMSFASRLEITSTSRLHARIVIPKPYTLNPRSVPFLATLISPQRATFLWQQLQSTPEFTVCGLSGHFRDCIAASFIITNHVMRQLIPSKNSGETCLASAPSLESLGKEFKGMLAYTACCREAHNKGPPNRCTHSWDPGTCKLCRHST